MLAAPMPTISGCRRPPRPVRAANDDAVEIVSVSETSAMPSAPASSGPRSRSRRSGIVNGGNPCGSLPTSDTPCSARSNRPAAAIDSTTATSTPGTRGNRRCSTRITARPRHADRQRRAGTVLPSATPSDEGLQLVR